MMYENPVDIERRSFEIIASELRLRRERLSHPGKQRGPLEESILMRVIHATADFEFEENLLFTHNAAEAGRALLRGGAAIITDTRMAMAGINKKFLEKYGGTVRCFIGDEDVVCAAQEEGTTRAGAAIDKAARLSGEFKNGLIFAVGNAPTALLRIHTLMQKEQLNPGLVVAVPVGFVNVAESKELFMDMKIPAVIARGRKGGSAAAAAIINAMLYYGAAK
jgi:precorrin-8X/cobalt-precorrin-8 methylmutase